MAKLDLLDLEPLDDAELEETITFAKRHDPYDSTRTHVSELLELMLRETRGLRQDLRKLKGK